MFTKAETQKKNIEAFKVVGNAVVEVKGGFPGSKIYLVTEATKLAAKDEYKDYDVWCVFDFDVKTDNPKQKQDFDNAIKKENNSAFCIVRLSKPCQILGKGHIVSLSLDDLDKLRLQDYS